MAGSYLQEGTLQIVEYNATAKIINSRFRLEDSFYPIDVAIEINSLGSRYSQRFEAPLVNDCEGRMVRECSQDDPAPHSSLSTCDFKIQVQALSWTIAKSGWWKGYGKTCHSEDRSIRHVKVLEYIHPSI